MKRILLTFTLVVICAASAQATPLYGTGSGLQCYLTFNNTIAQQCGAGRPSIAFKGLSTAKDLNVTPRYAVGKFGMAGDFRNTNSSGGVNDWAISFGSMNSPWYWNCQDWAFNLWVNTTTIADRSIFGWQDYTSGNNKGFSITNHPSQTILYGTGSARGLWDLSPPHGDGQWHMITVNASYAAQACYAYFDGVYLGSKSMPGWLGSSGYDTLVGASGLGKYAGTALIDEVACWANRMLTQDEINFLYANPLPEPMTLSMLGLGGLALLRRRK